MDKFETGNPVPSAEGLDLHDNSIALDDAMNSTAPTFEDRLGRTRKTWANLETDSVVKGVAVSPAALTENGTYTLSLPNDTTLRISVRGNDGTTRSVDLALT